MALNLTCIFEMVGSEKGVLKKGELAYRENHVISVLYDGTTGVLKGRVLPSQKKGVYDVEMLLSPSGDKIEEKMCTCARGQHFCHHMVALGLHAVNNISKTDRLCQWKKPRIAESLNSTEELFPRRHFTPISRVPDVRNLIQGLAPNSGFSWMLDEEEAVDPRLSILEGLRIEKIICALGRGAKWEAFIGLATVGPEEITRVEALTMTQRTNPLWHQIRSYRITGSNFGAVISAVSRKKYPESLFKSLLGQYDASSARSIQWGINHEAQASSECESFLGWRIEQKGFIMHPSGMIGVSPDGFIGENAVVEIKCPYSIRDQALTEAFQEVRKTPFFLLKKGDHVELNLRSSLGLKYYHQVQGLMHVCQRPICKFVVWTNRDLLVFDVNRDDNWGKNLDLIQDFYKEQLFPKLVEQICQQ